MQLQKGGADTGVITAATLQALAGFLKVGDPVEVEESCRRHHDTKNSTCLVSCVILNRALCNSSRLEASLAMRKSWPSWPTCALATAPGESQGLGGHSTALARAQGHPRPCPRVSGGTHCASRVAGMPRAQMMERYMSQGAKLRNVEQAPRNAVCKLSERLSGKNSRWHEGARRS